ncbi:glyoxalase superfamily protein [Parafilimonas sp.]|uniref:glyoxalase superfamily protein n=1 Tax=Parafilimonas sp. TaxID=1969739 RepID=UPI0039E5C532
MKINFLRNVQYPPSGDGGNRPGLEETFYGALAFTVNDPFNNKIVFNQKLADKTNE